MSPLERCPKCDALLPPGRNEELCPRCLLQMAMSPATASVSGDSHFVAPSLEAVAVAFPQLSIESLIGQGGMGAVYRARQKGLDRVVALKILPPSVAAREGFAQRFEREARALARLNHPHIVSVFDSGRSGDYYYLMMEYVDGINLRQAIQAQQMTCAEALQVVPQICEALQYAHDQGVVHRDIKPENILLNPQGQIKIADFGLARMLDANALNPTLTAAHHVLGTPRYMAPEQIEGTHAVDHRADIYSLGVVFYELLTGELPLGRFAAPSQRPGIDRRLDEIVYRTLEKRPDQRYQHASELKTDVERVSNVVHHHHHHRYRTDGYDYKSKMTLFGLPWVHVASGYDPVTGRKRIAKGFFAVGDVAIGVFSVGGVSMGVFSIGGVSFSVFCLSGLAFGLVAALGGLAIGPGLAAGGVAIGGIALGGLATGYVALGGAAFGVHSLGGTGISPEDRLWFREMSNYLPSAREWLVGSLSLVGGLLASVVLCYFIALFGNRRRESLQPQPTGQPTKPPKVAGAAVAMPTDRGTAAPQLIGCLLILILVCVPAFLMLMLAAGLLFSYTTLRQVPTESMNRLEVGPVQEYSASSMMMSDIRRGTTHDYWTAVDYIDGRPQLSEAFVEELGVDERVREELNHVLTSSHEQAMNLTGMPDSASSTSGMAYSFEFGQRDREDFQKIGDAVWLEFDKHLDDEQLELAKERIHLFPKPPPADDDQSCNATVYPSVLMWGGEAAKVSFWYEKEYPRNEVHWLIESQETYIKSVGPQLPPELDFLMTHLQ